VLGCDAERDAAASGAASGAVICPGEGRAVAGGALRHAESDAAMVMAEQTLEVPAGAARARLVGVEKDAWSEGTAPPGAAFHYLGTMTDNAAGRHSKVIGSSPSSSASVWTHTEPGADTVARRACR
jgi:hypothetical protein